MLNDVTHNIDNKLNVDLSTIDLSRAFDSISHSKLIQKLEAYGISGKILLWIKSFLTNRTFNVLVNGISSINFPVTSSVPQGSKLGPLCYIIYANDLIKKFKFAQVKMYADDLSVYATVTCNEDRIKLQEDLDYLCDWANVWCLKINYDKCKLLHFGYSNNKYSYCLNGNSITESTNERVLGVIIDSNLIFKEHIYTCIKKASNICNLILLNLSHMNCDILVNLYKCFARPILEYSSVVFSPHNLYLIDALEHVQRNFTKRLPGLHDIKYNDRLRICKLETLELRRLHTDLIMVYKIVNNLMTINLNGSVKLFNNVGTRGNTYKLTKNYARLDIRKFFFCNRIVDVWNMLDKETVCSRNLHNFKHKLLLTNLSRYLKGRAYK